MRILVTGAGGQLGREVQQVASQEGHEVIAMSRQELDIVDPEAVRTALRCEPDLVINCAAYTAVDRAEHEPERAFAVNRDGAANLAAQCGRLVHLSTDYVFDGTSRIPYVEDAVPSPLNVYGASKLAGEKEVLKHERHLVVRTSWVFGPHGDNFIKKLLRKASQGEDLAVVADQTGCPTAAEHLARIVLGLGIRDTPPGLYHYADSPSTTWYDFGLAVLRRAGIDRPVRKLTSRDLPTPRPAYTVLDCTRTLALLGEPGYRWETAL